MCLTLQKWYLWVQKREPYQLQRIDFKSILSFTINDLTANATLCSLKEALKVVSRLSLINSLSLPQVRLVSNHIRLTQLDKDHRRDF